MATGYSAVNDPDVLDKVARLYKQGKKNREIAAEMKLNIMTVQRCLHKRGLRKNRNFTGR